MSSPHLDPCFGPGQLLADPGHLGSENLGLITSFGALVNSSFPG